MEHALLDSKGTPKYRWNSVRPFWKAQPYDLLCGRGRSVTADSAHYHGANPHSACRQQKP